MIRGWGAVVFAAAAVISVTGCARDVQRSGRTFAHSEPIAVEAPPSVSLSELPSEGAVLPGILKLAFSVQSRRAVSRTYCQLDNATPVSCSSPFEVKGVSNGRHRVRVTVWDDLGRMTAMDSPSYLFDSDAPTPTASPSPEPFTKNTQMTFNWTLNATGGSAVSSRCQLDSGAEQACQAPLTVTGLTEGSHTLKIVGANAAGVRSTPLALNFVTDLTAPTLQWMNPPLATAVFTNSLTLNFTAADAGSSIASISCQVDSLSPAPCASATAHTFAISGGGSHSFTVVATDRAGNATSQTIGPFLFDPNPPTVSISSGPAQPTADTSASFAYSANDGAGSGVSHYLISLDGGASERVTSTTYSVAGPLTAGQHTLSVVAVDFAGNASSPAGFSWSITLPLIGMDYSLFNCPISNDPRYNPSGTIYDISKAKLDGSFGPVGQSHWWGKPDLGYYCLLTSDEILIKHAEMIRDLGVDFVTIDITNWPNRFDSQNPGFTASTDVMVIQPLEKLLRLWSQVPGAPKVVPWVPIVGQASNLPGFETMIDYLRRLMPSYPSLQLIYQGKPLLLTPGYTPPGLPPFSNFLSPQFIGAETQFTIRSMWSLLPLFTTDPFFPGVDRQWAWVQPCSSDFKANNGQIDCNQPVGHSSKPDASGAYPVESIGVTAAYQSNYISDTSTATPKFQGRTLIKQLKTAWLNTTASNSNPKAKFISISQWNEWSAGRQNADLRYAFVDQFDVEYNRDIEPGGGLGAFYYYLLKEGLKLLRSGQNPEQALVNVPFQPYKIIGALDPISTNAAGSKVVSGWVCRKNDQASVQVRIFVGGPMGMGTEVVSSLNANLPSEQAVAKECQSIGMSYRFSVPVSAFSNPQARGAVYVYGFSQSPAVPQHLMEYYSAQINSNQPIELLVNSGAESL